MIRYIVILLLFLPSIDSGAQTQKMKKLEIKFKSGSVLPAKDGYLVDGHIKCKVATPENRRINNYYNAKTETFPLSDIQDIRYSNKNFRPLGVLTGFFTGLSLPIVIKRPEYIILFPFFIFVGNLAGSHFYYGWKSVELPGSLYNSDYFSGLIRNKHSYKQITFTFHINLN